MLLGFYFLFRFVKGDTAKKPCVIKDLNCRSSGETIKNYFFPVSRWHECEDKQFILYGYLACFFMAALSFQLQHTDTQSKARAGKITTDHGEILTPIFMPVGTA